MSDTATLVSDKASIISSQPNGVPTVIAFGTTGAGKSSVINMLPDDPAYPAERAEAKASTAGVTAKVKPFHKIVDGRPFSILDTMGVGEVATGTVPTHLAIEGLYNHLVTSSTQVHLVLIVMKAGRLTSLDECNYLLARYLFGDEVPIALILTHMDAIDNMETWWDEQENRGKLGLLQCVGVVSSMGRMNVLEKFHDQSKLDLSRFMATQVPFGPGYQLLPKPRVSILTAALNSLLGKFDEAAPFHAAMLSLLKSYHIPDRHAGRLASKLRVAAPLPVVIFVGAPASGKSTIISMLAADQDGAAGPTTPILTPGGVQEHIKVVKGERIRLLETPGIPFPVPSEFKAASLDRGVRALRDSLVAHPFGIRLIVLVAKVGRERLAPVDIQHYQLVRQLCGNRVPVCLITIQSDNNLNAASTLDNKQMPLHKHICLPIIAPGAPQQQLDLTRRLVENALAGLVQSTVDSKVPPNLFNTSVETPAPLRDTKPNPSSFPISSKAPTVITFGTTGAGRSSVINMLPDNPVYLAEKAVAKASVVGVTTEVKHFHKMVNGRPFTILDTMGTGEMKTGTVPTHLAIGRLYDHLIASSTPAIHLVLIVMKAGRMTSLDECNYLLARYLFGDEVPIALVLTHMDRMENKNTWWNEQENRGRLGLLDAVGVVSFIGLRNNLEPLYDESRERLCRFISTQLYLWPGLKLQGKPHISRLTAPLTNLVPIYNEASRRLYAAMLDLLKDYEIETRHAKPLAAKMQVVAPLPVVVFVGARGSGKTMAINMLPTDEDAAPLDPSVFTPTPGDVQKYIRIVNGQRVRALEPLSIPLPSQADPASLFRAVRALHDSFMAHPLGIRLVVLVAKLEGENLAPIDITHYRAVRQLCGDRVPVCLITVQAKNSSNRVPITRNKELAFQKHISLPMVSSGATQRQGDKSKSVIEGAIASLVKSNIDSPVQPAEDIRGVLRSLPGYEAFNLRG